MLTSQGPVSRQEGKPGALSPARGTWWVLSSHLGTESTPRVLEKVACPMTDRKKVWVCWEWPPSPPCCTCMETVFWIYWILTGNVLSEGITWLSRNLIRTLHFPTIRSQLCLGLHKFLRTLEGPVSEGKGPGISQTWSWHPPAPRVSTYCFTSHVFWFIINFWEIFPLDLCHKMCFSSSCWDTEDGLVVCLVLGTEGGRAQKALQVHPPRPMNGPWGRLWSEEIEDLCLWRWTIGSPDLRAMRAPLLSLTLKDRHFLPPLLH